MMGMTVNDPTATNWAGDVASLNDEELRDRRLALASVIACNVLYERVNIHGEVAQFKACIDEGWRRLGVR